MRIEIGPQKPEHFKTYWDGQYDLFSHFEYACGIPSALFMITTLKENGKPNACFGAWSSFTGDAGGYYAVIGGLNKNSHTWQNIQRTGEFIINFVSNDYYEHCIATIGRNGADEDEIVAGGFTEESAKTVGCPRIAEAFLCLECKLEKQVDLSGSAQLIIGKVGHIAMQEAYAGSLDAKYGESGFMFNIHAPKDLRTDEGKPSAVAVCKIVRINEEG
mgnify:FL=1